MFYDFNCSTRAGACNNEDAIYYNHYLMVVIDAATNLTKINYTSEKTDGCWLSKNSVSLLAEILSNPETSISDALYNISVELKSRLDKMGYNGMVESYPSGSMIIAREVNDTINLFSIGDCTAIIEFNNGYKEMLVHDDSVTKLDNAVIDRLISMHKQSGKPINELIPNVNDMLIANRKKRNQKDGYWIFDPTGAAIAHGTSLSFKRCDVASIALMSDGFNCITSMDSSCDALHLLKTLKITSADVLIDKIFAELDKDIHFNKYPRFKLKDDASIVYARIK